MLSIKTTILMAIALQANAKALSKRGAGTSATKICNHAWSNSGNAKRTDCSGADVIFSSVSDTSDVVQAGLSSSSVTSMVYLSVGTVRESSPADPRLLDFIWEENQDDNGSGGTWEDHWFHPEDLDEVLPIMQDIMLKYKEMGYDMISTDNASPSTAVTDNDQEAARYRAKQRVDPRYVTYMQGIIDYGKEIGMQVALKNPSYYVHESLIDQFDAYIVESLFNWYPHDINNYNGSPNLLTGSIPMWIFQYEGTNGVSNSELKERMEEQGVDMVYLDGSDGWEEFYA